MKKVALFPGSFDPFTKGHEDIALRGAKLFDELIIGLGVNTSKTRYVEESRMIDYIKETFKEVSNIKVISFHGLTAVFAEEIGATHILRGVRNTTDFEYENTIAQANKNMNPDLETVFLITSPALAHISSTITREIHKLGGDVKDYLPYQFGG